MVTQSRTNHTRFGIVATLLTSLIITSAAFWSGCSRQSAPQNTNLEISSSPAERQSQVISQPYSLGEADFTSQQAFVEQIRPRCATEEPPPAIRLAIVQRIEAMRESIPEERAPGSVEIPVYFHILTNSAGSEGNLSDADVQRQIDVLNVAYAGNGSGGTGSPTPFRFVLAAVDRTANDAWFNMSYSLAPSEAERAAKAALNKGGKSAVNFYTAKLDDSTLGWARWPWDIAAGGDGVVVRYSTLPGGSTTHYDQGDTATHEVGHWLGLFHTFQGGCDDPGDEVDDTAAERSPAAGCPAARDTCPAQTGGDPIENFMDYSDDVCMFKFSAGQSTRMDAAHLRYRR